MPTIHKKRDAETEEDLLLFAHNMVTELGFVDVTEDVNSGETKYLKVYQFPSDQQRRYYCPDLDCVLAFAESAYMLLQASTQGNIEDAIRAIASIFLDSGFPLDLDKREKMETVIINLLVEVKKKDVRKW